MLEAQEGFLRRGVGFLGVPRGGGAGLQGGAGFLGGGSEFLGGLAVSLRVGVGVKEEWQSF